MSHDEKLSKINTNSIAKFCKENKKIPKEKIHHADKKIGQLNLNSIGGNLLQNSNMFSRYADDKKMEELYDELLEDVELIGGAYQVVAKLCKKGGSRKSRQCFE